MSSDLYLCVRGSDVQLEMVDDAVITAGSDPDCDIVLAEDAVAGRHCTFEAHGPELRVRDLDSQEGTFINQRRVDNGVAWAGDTVRLGSCVVEVRGRPEAATEFQTVIDSDRAYESVIQKRFEPSILNRISERLAGARDIHGLADATLGGILEVTPADRAAFLLRRTDPSTGDVEVAAARSRTVSSAKFSVSRTLVADVIDEGVSTFAHDASADQRFNEEDDVVAQHIRSVMCVPLRAADDILGALYVDTLDGAGRFGEADLDLLSAIGNYAGVALHRVRLLQQLERQSLDTVRAIAATIDAKDGYTHRHSERVAMLAKRLGAELRLPPDELETIELSGLLHDVGKIAVPDAILNKAGRLTPAEFTQMKEHPAHGARILENIQSPAVRAVLPGVRHHHEKWDGTGYPDGLRGVDIPLLPRLLGIADFYDAVTSARSYRGAMAAQAAVDLITAASGSHFEPSLAALVARLHQRGDLLPEGWE